MIPYPKYPCCGLDISSNFAYFHNVLIILNRLTILGRTERYEQFCCGTYTCQGTFVQLKHKDFKKLSAQKHIKHFKKVVKHTFTSTLKPLLTHSWYLWLFTICRGTCTCQDIFVRLKHKHLRDQDFESTSNTLKKVVIHVDTFQHFKEGGYTCRYISQALKHF